MVTKYKFGFYYCIMYLIFYAILLNFSNQGLFHHDALQLFKAIANDNIGQIVNYRFGMYYLYYFSGFTIIPILLSLLSIFFVYLIGNLLYKKGLQYAILFSLIPPFFSVSTYPNSNLPMVLFSLISLYCFLSKKQVFSGLFIMVGMVFRTEIILLFIVYSVMFFNENKKKLCLIYILIFLIFSPLLLFQGNQSDFSFSLNFLILFMFVLALGLLPLTIKYNQFSKIYILGTLITLIPFLLIPTTKARMLIIPIILFMFSIKDINKNLYKFIPMGILTIYLMFSYNYYDTFNEIIIDNDICKNIDYWDYSEFFDMYGMEKNCNDIINQKVLLYHNSDILPNIKILNINNSNISLI